MVIDFSKVNLRDRPTLVLRNASGEALQTLGYAYNIEIEILYNEVSTLTFDIPAYVNGVKTPRYDDIVGMTVVDLVGWGQFVLVEPTVVSDGINETKSCKAYSLEYELTYKQITVEYGTYNFWNPMTPESSILGIILTYLPSWRVGEVSDTLIGKYRTFEENGENLYNFIKSTVQNSYRCVFDFDTYERKINVRDMNEVVITKPVYISLDNLAKEIEVTENTEDIYTVLDVHGADDITIRSVNPTGTNKIYNLDYFMNETNFSPEIIRKWQSWKDTCDSYREVYYDLTVQSALITAEITNTENKLYETTYIDLASLENEQSVYIEFLASLSDKTSEAYAEVEEQLHDVNRRIADTEDSIQDLKREISSMYSEKADITAQLEDINDDTALRAFFTADEYKMLDRYFKEESIEESSFAVGVSKYYTDHDVAEDFSSSSYELSGGTVVYGEQDNGRRVYTIRGGTLSGSNNRRAEIVRGTVEVTGSDKCLITAYLGSGVFGDFSFVSSVLAVPYRAMRRS